MVSTPRARLYIQRASAHPARSSLYILSWAERMALPTPLDSDDVVEFQSDSSSTVREDTVSADCVLAHGAVLTGAHTERGRRCGWGLGISPAGI